MALDHWAIVLWDSVTTEAVGLHMTWLEGRVMRRSRPLLCLSSCRQRMPDKKTLNAKPSHQGTHWLVAHFHNYIGDKMEDFNEM